MNVGTTALNENELASYWSTLDRAAKEQLASEVVSSVNHLRQVFLYGKKVSAKRAKALADHTGLGVGAFMPELFDDE